MTPATAPSRKEGKSKKEKGKRERRTAEEVGQRGSHPSQMRAALSIVLTFAFFFFTFAFFPLPYFRGLRSSV
jgi:hypothetical protein